MTVNLANIEFFNQKLYITKLITNSFSLPHRNLRNYHSMENTINTEHTNCSAFRAHNNIMCMNDCRKDQSEKLVGPAEGIERSMRAFINLHVRALPLIHSAEKGIKLHLNQCLNNCSSKTGFLITDTSKAL